MLRRTPARPGSRALVAWLGALAALASAARAADGVGEPERLTAGIADQFLAVLDPDASRMFYVSNENATTELFGVDLDVRAPQRLFDEAADVTWPRVSPDGRTLLYLSFRSAATGELCLRELSPRGLGVSERRCFSLGGRTAMHALWEPGSKSVLVVSRDGLGGAIDSAPLPGARPARAARRGAAHARHRQPRHLARRPLPALRSGGAPGGGPRGSSCIARGHSRLTRIARRDRPELRQRRRARAQEPAARPPRRPRFTRARHLLRAAGFPGFPAFSADDKFVYFVQYLNDTNHDGVVDANDRGVLFRVPFDAAREAPIDGTRAQQLTSAEWDCQYPFPGRTGWSRPA